VLESAGVMDVLTKSSAPTTRTTWCARRSSRCSALRDPDERAQELGLVREEAAVEEATA
jgi:hypothetical protein